MTNDEWLSIVKLMKSNFRAKDFIPDKDTADMWFNYFNQYIVDDVKVAVADYIRNESYAPTIHELDVYCKKAQSTRKTVENISKAKTKYVKCLNCLDEGYTLKTYPNGSDECVPCDCEAGRTRFKWFFLSKKERNDIMMEEARRGLKPCFSPWTCSEEFTRSYYSGTR